MGNKLKEQDLQTTNAINAPSTSQDPLILQIQDIREGFGVTAHIHNIGTGNATNVS
jgi:hypothetical protein